MILWRRHRGDVNDYVDVKITGVDSLVSVTAVTATVQFGGEAIVPLTAVVYDAAARIVRVALSPWLATAKIGCWRLAAHLTFTGPIGPLTYPEGEPAEIEVLPAA